MSRRLLGLLIVASLLAAFTPAAAYAALDDSPPGLPLSLSPVSGTLLSPLGDTDDWYGISLAEGDQLTLSLRGDTGTDFSMSLYSEDLGTGEGDELFMLWFWSGLYPRETSYVVRPGAGGTYYVRLHGTDGQGAPGSYSLTWTKKHDITARLYGMDRYQTSVAISRSTFATATTAVIASGENFPDALAASGLAGVLDAPVLLTRKGYVPDDVMRELQRLRVTEVCIIGSKDAVSLEAETMLSADPPDGAGYVVDRLGGDDRYDTAKRVAERIVTLGGSREVFLVTGTKYADALAVAPAAFARRMPVLLTRPGVMPDAALAALVTLETTHVVVAGSTASVSSSVATSASVECLINDMKDGTVDGHSVERWEGVDRYETAVDVAENASALGWIGWTTTALATGRNFPDALGGGAAMGKLGGTLLLTDPRFLSASTATELESRLADIGRAYLLGSTSALSEQVRTDTAAALLP